jgi:hypothetical protein
MTSTRALVGAAAIFGPVAARQQVWRLGGGALRLGDRAATVAESRRGVGAVFLVSLAVWWLEALVIPLGQGRDLGTYLGAYVQLFQAHPIDLGYVLGRTPVASLIVGGLLDFGGGALAEPVVSLLYAVSIVAWYLAARRFGGRAAVLTVVVLLAYPGYGIIFHELSSDAVFAAAFAGWSYLAIRVLFSPSVRGFALVGTGVGILALIRPGNQILLVLALLPLLLRAPWRTRLFSAAAFVAPAVVLLAGWAVHNGIRYDNYTVARGGNATVPFYRVFVTDRIVRPSNGPATRELARVVQRDLLPKEPYRSYGITLDDFFNEASSRMEVDLLSLSDRLKGWHSNYRWLRDVGFEAVRTHPGDYASGVVSSTWGLLTQAVFRSPSSDDGVGAGNGGTAAIGGGTLPKPSEGEPIPAAHEGGVTTPDGSIYTVWTSPTEHHLVFVHPGDEKRYEALHERMDELGRNLPGREGSPTLAHRLNQSSRWFPPPVLWFALALVALAYRRPQRSLALVTPAVAALVVIVLSALGLPAEPHYSVPVAPAFFVLAGGALFARRRELATEPSWRVRVSALGAPVLRVAGVGVGVVAALWAAKIYVSRIDNAFDARRAPHDLDVFLRAAGKVIDFASPYTFHADQTYAYPPLLAFLVSPLHAASAGTATLVWTLLSLAAIAASLWFLGVRDWRCYALAAVYPFTRSAVDLGTVGPLLLLGVAAVWRWRERLVEPAAALGAAVALKLFLWPLAVWLALTGRIRTAFAGVGFALAFVLVPWAVIGFGGVGDYPGLLHRLSDDEASSSYSVIALGVRAHLPEAVGVVLSVLAAAALLAVAVGVARAGRRLTRGRDVAVLTLCLAAALAASPIVWVHYFLLLLVPLALTQPRLSLLWFVPFAYYPLGESAWPAGDARKLGIALVATSVIIGVALIRGLRDADRPAEAAGAVRPRNTLRRLRREPAELPKA